MKRIGIGILIFCNSLLLAGCGDNDKPAEMATPTTPPVSVASPGGAPTYGTPSGMGFSTGDADHSDGAGSGLMGYHGTGALGTSSAITDNHPISPPSRTLPDPVLPAP